MATGTPEEMRESDNPYVRQFMEGKTEGPIRVREERVTEESD
jgi:ABC-type transporter Mla maintaining outer membrane lipid asymmetry ATPase subunit MlaF